MQVYFRDFDLILLINLSVSMEKYHGIFISIALQFSLKSGMVIPPEDMLLYSIGLGNLGFLVFHMKLIIVFSMSVKNCVGICMGIALNLYIAFGKMIIFIMLILWIYEHGRSFHLLMSSVSFFRDLKFLSYLSFNCLIRVTSRQFFILCGYCEECVSLMTCSVNLLFV